MDDLGIEKIQISGPTLASLLNRLSASPGDLHGLLYGHDSSATLIGWFSGRRRTPLRPSLHDSTATLSLNSSTSLSFTPKNSPHSVSLPPSLFLLLTTPFQDQLIHTHEYKAFQYRISTSSFEPKSLDIINIGPYFRSHYESFTPNSPFPPLTCDLRSSNAMVEDENTENSAGIQRGLKDQKELDVCAQGFEVARFSKLMGSNAANYTAEVEELYDKMLAKLDSLARLVEKSSAKVLEQESHNMKLRCKVAGLE
nr:BRCA1-A complex subunit Abraxas like [Ipomoea batatas]